MAAFVNLTWQRLMRALRRDPAAALPELWCRPATVLALRNRARAPDCLSGWH